MTRFELDRLLEKTVADALGVKLHRRAETPRPRRQPSRARSVKRSPAQRELQDA